MSLGIDPNRTNLLLAVLEKRVGLALLGDDVFVSVAGGLEVDEPAADLGVAAAIASSFRNRAVPMIEVTRKACVARQMRFVSPLLVVPHGKLIRLG